MQDELEKFEFFPIAVDEDGIPVLDAAHTHLDDNDIEYGCGDDVLDCMLPSEVWLATKEGNVIGVRDFQSTSHGHGGQVRLLLPYTFSIGSTYALLINRETTKPFFSISSCPRRGRLRGVATSTATMLTGTG